jgi:hypothetical protein
MELKNPGTPETHNGQASSADTTSSNQTSADELRAEETSEMKKWAEAFKVEKPIPQDLLPILSKNEVKQMEIVMKNMNLRR